MIKFDDEDLLVEMEFWSSSNANFRAKNYDIAGDDLNQTTQVRGHFEGQKGQK